MFKRVLIADIIPDVSGAISLGPFGSNLNTQHYTNEGLPVIRGINLAGDRFSENSFAFTSPSLAEKFPRSVVYPGDIVFSYKGTIGQVGIIPKDGRFDRYIISPSHLKLTVDRVKADPEFIFYFFKSPLGQRALLANVSSTGTPGIIQPTKTLARIELPLPEVNEQRAIAHILSTLDDKIELNRRMNETLEGIARALFKSWFIDFDPVRVKAKGKQPVGMDEETAALFPSELEDSDLGEMPKGWRNANIFEFSDLNAWTLGKNDVLEIIDYIEISEVSRGEIANTQTFSRGEEPSRARRRLRHGDTVISTVRPDRGSYFLCLNPPENLIASTGFTVITPKDAPWSFIYEVLTQQSIFEYLGQQADGGAYPAIRPEIIGNIQFVMPDKMELVEKYHRLVTPILELAHNNRIQSKTLSTLRDKLLPELISGDIRVSAHAVSNLQAGIDVSAPTE